MQLLDHHPGVAEPESMILIDFTSISVHGIPDASGLLRLQLNMQRAATTEPPIEMLKSYCLKWFGISNKVLKTPGNCSPAWKIKYATVPAGVALKAGTNLTFEPTPILATSGFGRSMFHDSHTLPKVDGLLPNGSLVEMLQLLGTPSNHEAQCKGRQEL